jgi:hypothetical protein
MRFAVSLRRAAPFAWLSLATPLVLSACSGPIAPTHTSRSDAEPRVSVMRPPPNAPPDPLGTQRPGDRSCAEDRDCKAGETCFAPDSAPSSGPPPQCQTDDQCPGQICDGTSCVSPCRADSCGPDAQCRDDGHCAPLACTDPHGPVCPQNFRCTGPPGASRTRGAPGGCERLRCTSRSQCDVGVCYHGRCFSHDAYCMPQPKP